MHCTILWPPKPSMSWSCVHPPENKSASTLHLLGWAGRRNTGFSGPDAILKCHWGSNWRLTPAWRTQRLAYFPRISRSHLGRPAREAPSSRVTRMIQEIVTKLHDKNRLHFLHVSPLRKTSQMLSTSGQPTSLVLDGLKEEWNKRIEVMHPLQLLSLAKLRSCVQIVKGTRNTQTCT